MMKNIYSQHAIRQQSGMALVICLVLLLVITLISIAGLNSASDQQKMAVNAQQINQSFHNAESAVSQAIMTINGTATRAGSNIALSEALNSDDPLTKNSRLLTQAGLINVTITFRHQKNKGLKPGMSLNADENSTIIGENRFILEGEAVMVNSGARAVVSQGISYE